jgi:hypothetical protein
MYLFCTLVCICDTFCCLFLCVDVLIFVNCLLTEDELRTWNEDIASGRKHDLFYGCYGLPFCNNIPLTKMTELNVSMCLQKPGDVVVVPPGTFYAKRHLTHSVTVVHYILMRNIFASPLFGIGCLKHSCEIMHYLQRKDR